MYELKQGRFILIALKLVVISLLFTKKYIQNVPYLKNLIYARKDKNASKVSMFDLIFKNPKSGLVMYDYIIILLFKV
jgi:hypothetical protein